ncbi:uncharacterized protein OCT59_013325 [Rhizophagus irregularis]|uniref:Uncharacterized protein n=1 Tax=Rhizophagus irregularis (strain DAOM 181602 / DAOM 197198 / MUCL 43194) TaxID=747089 RepID=A0A2P4P651_RHIID|nr:hypothetical protein GLOIN_2v1709517 [Rhizophagus irregularis DAOM 181602=DAOM 197198]POG60837.1 hypothetical protein GLOIN_2v1709517 [Rhizophagus irregularis DAOM 181602=DAOM 197198]UZO20916.1 hypothetical protein OCT59_013325 [Rhizophagus irregularis]GBC27602.2 kinase-like domain-containing protein [Rhizophagus irregularis DAOM 181602=DAOM 197198]|eukprot:XP_025167703.1 hypothetical protein GLOIN_2v1709517 [Rhizophagus irregularis DAOM 181602=DAOM 197198]
MDTTINNNSKTNIKNLWKIYPNNDYQKHVKIDSADDLEGIEILMEDLEKRKEVCGICGECNEPGTGFMWCQPCNAKRFKENFKNWTSGSEVVDEVIQQSQCNAVHYEKCLEWVPFESIKDVIYVTMSNGHKLYKAYLSEGKIEYWDIENQKWGRSNKTKIAFKAIDDSYFKNTDSLNMVKNCFSGITQDPNTKEYMIILKSLQLWESYPNDDYQEHVTINSLTNSEDMTEKVIFMKDLEKRKQVYGICGECR